MKTRLPAALLLWMMAGAARAQTHIETMRKPDNAPTGKSIFTDAGYGKKWLGDFFPYQLPDAGDLHAAFGHMLSIYNTGILVLASIVALYSLIIFVVETAHHGRVGGQRSSALYGQLRLIVAIGLLVPVLNGYSSAQIIIVNLAHAGSGLANSMWTEFTPIVAATDFSLPRSYNDTMDGVLQKVLVSETCIAAVTLDTMPPATGTPSVTIQAFYRDPVNPAREVEGSENALALHADDAGSSDAMAASQAITTESEEKGLPLTRMRLHYNRAGYDDYCGAVDLPVPGAPSGVAIAGDDQTLYAAPLLQIRPVLAKYGNSMATAVASKLAAAKPPAASGAPAAASPASVVVAASSTPTNLSAQAIAAAAAAGSTAGQAATSTPPAATGKSANPTAPPAVELPQATMSPGAWADLVNHMDNGMAAMADHASHDYIDKESQSIDLQPKSGDWAEAGSLFFKLTKLSHDNLKLRDDPITATLPDPAILPAEMRNDGVLASCAPVLDNVFLADYNCRQDGRKTTLAIKVAYNLIHTVESQRGTSVVSAIDGASAANRKEDTVSRHLFANAGLDAVVAALAKISSRQPVKDQHSAMFDLVNVGNILLMSTSGLFGQSALTGQLAGGMSQSLLLTMFGVLLVVPAIFLSIVLPLLPAIRFFLGIVAWILTIFEGLVIFPLVILGSLRSDGEGLFAHGRQGYVLLLQMMLRPVLMVFGMMAALIIFDALYEFVTWTIWSGLLNLSDNSGQLVSSGIQGVLELTGYLFLWSFLIYLAANLSFRAITIFPDRALVWMGSLGAGGGQSSSAAIEGGLSTSMLMPGGPGSGAMRGVLAGGETTQTQITSRSDTASVTAITGSAGPSQPSHPRNRHSDHFPLIRNSGEDAAPPEVEKDVSDGLGLGSVKENPEEDLR